MANGSLSPYRLCAGCDAPADALPGKGAPWCSDCKVARRAAQQQVVRAVRKHAGLCVKCAKPLSLRSGWLCAGHLAAYVRYTADYTKRVRARLAAA